jgi:hypothetical protein
MGYSLARWRQRKDYAELLNQLWVSILERDFTLQNAKPIADSAGPPAAVLNVKSIAAPKVGHNMAELRRRIKESQSWERLFTLLMAVSALERFMLAITTAAIESDPLRTPGFPKMLDGLALKKRDIQIAQPNLTSIVQGDWNSRISSLERLFGSVPSLLKDSRSELESIRRMRNSIAHDFGSRDSDGIVPPSVSLITGARADRLVVPRHGLSQDRLIRWVELLTDISIALDAQLTAQHIGEYEIPAVYLDWKKSPDAYEKALGITLKGVKKSHDQRFSNFISRALDAGYSPSYVRGLEKCIASI